jgi:ubiquinone/menaquinone biosynthesis C-methylase UbiE
VSSVHKPADDVPLAFDDVAHHYDRMVGLSPGYHEQLRASARAFAESLGPTLAGEPHRLIDLGCGSGASTAALVTELRRAGVSYTLTGIDASAAMLKAARSKAWPDCVTFELARAEAVACSGPDAVGDRVGHTAVAGRRRPDLDGIFAAYLLRNVADRDALLQGLFARLHPGAPLVVHDYCVRGDRTATAAWTALSWGVIVPTAVAVTRRPALFTYLWRSVLEFDTAEEIMQRMLRAGFTDVRTRPVPGWQRLMVRTFHGRRPR